MGVKVGISGGGVLALAGVAAVAAAGFYLYSKRGVITRAAGTVVNSVNPASSENLVNRAVSGIGSAVTGNDSWNFGGQLAEWFSPSVHAANESMKAQPVRRKPAAGYAEVMPPNKEIESENARLLARYPGPELRALPYQNFNPDDFII